MHGLKGGKIYRCSFLINYKGSRYVLGIFAGSPKADVETLGQLFEENGFEEVYVDNKAPAQLAREIVASKGLKPLVSTTRYASLVELMQNA